MQVDARRLDVLRIEWLDPDLAGHHLLFDRAIRENHRLTPPLRALAEAARAADRATGLVLQRAAALGTRAREVVEIVGVLRDASSTRVPVSIHST